MKWIAARVYKHMLDHYASDQNVYARAPALKRDVDGGRMGLGAQLVPLVVIDLDLAPVRGKYNLVSVEHFLFLRTRCEAA